MLTCIRLKMTKPLESFCGECADSERMLSYGNGFPVEIFTWKADMRMIPLLY